MAVSAAFRALVAEGDRWLEQATATYQGGGDFGVAAAEGSIASAYYARAAIEKPDAFASLVAASAAQRAHPTDPQAAERQAAKESGRHPAGRNRAGTTPPPRETPDDDPS